jgi:preprotein translocase subunit SecF
MQFLKNVKINFLGMRKVSLILSTLLVMVSVVFLFVKSPNWGIDFTGGALVHLEFENPVETKQLRSALEEGGIAESDIQRFRQSKVIIIKVKKTYGENNISGMVSDAITKGLPEAKFEVLRNEMVGPTVGTYLREKAVTAFIVAFIGMIIYIAWRFRGGIWGFAAVLALVHDVIVTFGILNFLGVTIDIAVVAALLTLAGYSINDSIVIYDRIRENIRLHYKKSLKDIINVSINSTLSRTVITSGTTLAVVLSILLKGGEVLNGFATALFVGIIVGTYSSIFIASPLVYVWQKKK